MIYIVSLFKELGVLVENRKTTKCENVKVCPLYNCTRATGGATRDGGGETNCVQIACMVKK